jgi:hypothetical protein
MNAWMKVLGAAVGMGALVAVGSAFTRPTPPSLSAAVTGDNVLPDRARPLLASFWPTRSSAAR